jgi:YebC/PmpR family DNA-binding regulatory protein
MAGHSHWSKIKRAKGANDAKRGKIWSKIARKIIIAAKNGGDPRDNLALRYTIEEAKGVNMPRDTIEKAIKKGTGELGAENYEAATYEGYAPGGVALLIECLTDNKNRSAMEVRTAMTRNGGSMADPGSVSYLFSRKGVIVVPQADGVDEDAVLMAVLDAGAEEVRDLGDTYEVVCEPGDLVAVRTALQDAGIDYDSADAGFVPSVVVELDADSAGKVFRLIDALEDCDDVQNVYANYDVSDEVMELIG